MRHGHVAHYVFLDPGGGRRGHDPNGGDFTSVVGKWACTSIGVSDAEEKGAFDVNGGDTVIVDVDGEGEASARAVHSPLV